MPFMGIGRPYGGDGKCPVAAHSVRHGIGFPVCHCEPVRTLAWQSASLFAIGEQSPGRAILPGVLTEAAFPSDNSYFLPLIFYLIRRTRLDLPPANCIRSECRAANDRPYSGNRKQRAGCPRYRRARTVAHTVRRYGTLILDP